MTTARGVVRRIINSYWRSGVVGALIIIDCTVLLVCFIDAARFWFSGLSLTAALRIAATAAIDGKSVGLGIAVLIFFLIALPMVIALISAVFVPLERWPKYLRTYRGGLLSAHVALTLLISGFTILAVSMEVMSGWAEDEGLRYSYMSFWLGTVSLGKPAYAAFVSPIIRKFLVRVSTDRNTTIKEVTKEIVTEESIERRVG